MKKIDRLALLLSAKSVLMLDKKVAQHKQHLKKLFDIFAKQLFESISDSTLFSELYNRAQTLRANYQNLTIDNQFKQTAASNFSSIFRSKLKNKINALNRSQLLKQTVFKAIEDAYNLGGSLAFVTTLLQVQAKKKTIRKAEEDGLIEEINTDGFKDVINSMNINWRLKDEKILNTLRGRVQSIDFVTDLDFEQISQILIDTAYERGDGIGQIKIALKEKLNGLSDYRSELIARTEMSIAQNKAIVDSAIKNQMRWKKWLTVGDERVREQHRMNGSEEPIVRSIHEAFGGGPMEMSPDDCESPFNCRCVIQFLLKDDDPLPNDLWLGNESMKPDQTLTPEEEQNIRELLAQ